MLVYVIEVVYNINNTAFSKISQVGYTNLLKAQKEIESKSEQIKKVNPFLYQSDKYSYFIWETIIE